MSLDEYEDKFVWICNGCEITVQFSRDEDFYACVHELKLRGWRITRGQSGEWLHRCSRCVRREQSGNVTAMRK